MSIKYYNSLIPGSPGHPGNALGSLANLLRECLVTGWTFGGTVTPPAGWEELFSETANFAAFRSLLGPRQIYQIDDNQTDSDVARMAAGESLAAVDGALGGEWGSTYFGKQYTGAASTSWHIIADARTAYIILESLHGHIIHGIGEFTSYVPDDPYNSFLAGHGISSALPSSNSNVPLHYGYDISTEVNLIKVHRSCIGEFAAYGGLLSNGTVGTIGSNGFDATTSANFGLGFPIVPAHFYCSPSKENGNNLVRGKMRGMYYPLSYRPLDHLETYIDQDTGKTMMCVHFESHSSYPGSAIFDMTGPW